MGRKGFAMSNLASTMSAAIAPTTLRIHKVAGAKKDALRINTAQDIPEFLRDSIRVVGEELALTCVEGEETAPLGIVIGYEPSEKTATGWNTWWIVNSSTNLVEKDGAFYAKATVLEAEPMTDEAPAILAGANIWRNEDGSWSYGARWGVQTGCPGQAYWVKSGFAPDGSPKGYILTKSEESYKAFLVCDEEGNDIGLLCEIDPA